MYVYENSGGSISTSFAQRFLFACNVQSSGNFTNDNVEDVSVLRNDSIFIFKGLGNSRLDSVPAFKMGGASGNYLKILFAQVNSKIEPYATLEGTTSNKDEIIMKQGSSIIIFNNNNANGISSNTHINGFFLDFDFKIADVNNDGYNDLVTTSIDQGIKIYLNNEGSIDTNVDYANNRTFSNPLSIDVADFNKDGWNDIAAATLDTIKIYLNTHSSDLFSQSVSYSKLYASDLYPLFGKKLIVADLHNKGGLSLVFSGYTAVDFETSPYPSNLEWMYRFNPDTLDAVPAPAYIFESNVQENDSIYHPQLLLFNRGDRDFMKYRIYKRNYVSYLYNLFDSTESDHYIDTTEDLLYMNVEPADPIPDNLFYYAVAVDNSYKVSVTSDTISYPAYVCPTCEGAIGPDNFAVSNERNILPKEYSLSNYPNPFNPSTKIKYTLPKEGIVKITIYNSLGQRVTELVNEFKQPGTYIAEFNALLAEQGADFPSGIYFYRFESNGIILTGRMLLIK